MVRSSIHNNGHGRKDGRTHTRTRVTPHDFPSFNGGCITTLADKFILVSDLTQILTTI